MKRDALGNLIPDIIKQTEKLYLHKTICEDGVIRLSYGMIPLSSGITAERRCPIIMRCDGEPLTKQEAEDVMYDDLIKKKVALEKWLGKKLIKKIKTPNGFNALLLYCYRVGIGSFRRSPVGRALRQNKEIQDIYEAFFECKGDPIKRKQEAELFIEGEEEIPEKEIETSLFDFIPKTPDNICRDYSRPDVLRLIEIAREIKSKRELGLVTSSIVDIAIDCFGAPFSKTDVSQKVVEILTENNAKDFIIDRNIASYHFDQKKIDHSLYRCGGNNKLILFYKNEKNIVEMMGSKEFFQYNRNNFSDDYQIEIEKEDLKKDFLNELNAEYINHLSCLILKYKKKQSLFTRSKQIALNYLISNINRHFNTKEITVLYNKVFSQEDRASSLTLMLSRPLFFRHLIFDESEQVYKKTIFI